MTSKTSDGSGADRPCIDTLEFARSGTRLAAVQRPSDFPRLLELLVNSDGRIEWSLSGEFRPRPEGGADAYLDLHIQGSVCLACIRCLQPVRAEFGDRRLFKITATESQAEREDAETDDYDALVAKAKAALAYLADVDTVTHARVTA